MVILLNLTTQNEAPIKRLQALTVLREAKKGQEAQVTGG